MRPTPHQAEILDLRAEAEAAAARERARQEAMAAAAEVEREKERRRQESAEEVANLRRQLEGLQSKAAHVEAELVKASKMASSGNPVLRQRMQPKVNSLTAEKAQILEEISALQEEIAGLTQ